MKLVKWDCGCKGFILESGENFVIECCDWNFEDPKYVFHTREMEDKDWIELSDEWLVNVMNYLVVNAAHGERAKEVANFLKGLTE